MNAIGKHNLGVTARDIRVIYREVVFLQPTYAENLAANIERLLLSFSGINQVRCLVHGLPLARPAGASD
jgi:hypothetical protein